MIQTIRMKKPEKKNKWLARQIESAKKNLEERPKWMKRASHFEGSYSGRVPLKRSEIIKPSQKD